MIRVALVVMVVAGCSSTARLADQTADGDSVAVVMATFEHHYPEIVLDSVAFNIQDRPPAEEALIRRIAALLRRPVARRSDLIRCTEEESPIPWPTCELVGFRRLIGFRIQSLEEDQALVGIGSTFDSVSDSGSHVWGESTLYELRRVNGTWVVTKALRSSAT